MKGMLQQRLRECGLADAGDRHRWHEDVKEWILLSSDDGERSK
jgi:hypothetical protein